MKKDLLLAALAAALLHLAVVKAVYAAHRPAPVPAVSKEVERLERRALEIEARAAYWRGVVTGSEAGCERVARLFGGTCEIRSSED